MTKFLFATIDSTLEDLFKYSKNVKQCGRTSCHRFADNTVKQMDERTDGRALILFFQHFLQAD